MFEELKNCTLCPRECGIDRTKHKGYCGCDDNVMIARAALHYWEEPCISGENGSGAVFFCGCTLKCCYCQNYLISHQNFGKIISVHRLSEIFLELQDKGAHNINLVTPTQYVPMILKALDLVKHRLLIPVVYNCGGYEKIDTINRLNGYVDIFLPDIKYYNEETAIKYSAAEGYFNRVSEAVSEMIRQTGKPELDCNGIIKKGVIIRHLVLPGHRKESMDILRWMKECLTDNSYMLSLMSQYTPSYKSDAYSEINRRVTTFEYDSVLDFAISLGIINGYMQDRKSAVKEYTPPFDLEGIERKESNGD
ncbi:MAG: radical SAM protein [Lachnospiraceae bacterium]|nr:radical SAM protein [Lachnospiraceae bacterium]